MKSGTPFRRANMMMAAIQAVMLATAGNMAMQQQQLHAIGPYESRGKGRGGPNRKAAGAGMANHRAAMKRRNVIKHRKACRT
jgi:hypothetical protein